VLHELHSQRQQAGSLSRSHQDDLLMQGAACITAHTTNHTTLNHNSSTCCNSTHHTNKTTRSNRNLQRNAYIAAADLLAEVKQPYACVMLAVALNLPFSPVHSPSVHLSCCWRPV
jgi:hypothetical protein